MLYVKCKEDNRYLTICKTAVKISKEKNLRGKNKSKRRKPSKRNQ